jgi:hypothetical protein
MAAPAILRVDIITDASKLQREVGKVEGTGSRLKSWAKGVGAAIAGAFAIDFAKDAIKSASNLAETMNKTEVVFGENAAAITRWSKTSATAMGLSQQEALEAASSFQTLFTQVGIGAADAEKMSTGIVQISSDLASFHNVAGGAAHVTDLISAAMRGEYDSLQKLIPTINYTAVSQKAMAMTGKTNAKELTNAEKAAATYALVLEGAGPAAGDFARTSGGMANQQRIAAAQFENTKAALGQALLPTLTKVMQFINTTVIPAFQWLSRNNLVIPILGLTAAVWALNAALAANPVVLITIAVIAFIAAIALLWANWDQVWTWIMEHKAYAAILAFLFPIAAQIVALVGVVRWFAANWDAIWGAVKGATAAVVSFFQDRFGFLGAYFAGVVALWRGYFQAIAAAFRIIMDAATAVYDWVKGKFDALAGAISTVLGGISTTVGRIVNAIKGPINGVIRAWNRLEFKVPEVNVGPLHFGGQTIGFPDIPELATGGYVSRTGLALVHRGETFSGVGGSGFGTVHIHVTTTGLGADAPEIQRAVANALRGYTARNGPLDIPTRSA